MGLAAAFALTAGSGAVQSYNQAKAGRENQRIDEYNAKVSDLQATDAIQRGENDSLKQRAIAKRAIGRQRAALAASGMDINSGTASDIQDETHALGELDALTIRNNAAREAWGYRVQAKGRRMQGSIDRSQADRAATGTLLTTGADAYRMGYGARRAQMGD